MISAGDSVRVTHGRAVDVGRVIAVEHNHPVYGRIVYVQYTEKGLAIAEKIENVEKIERGEK